MPGGSSAELHGGQGELRGSTVYLGGWQVPHTGAVRGKHAYGLVSGWLYSQGLCMQATVSA